jgi:hypothetical protein
MGDFPVTNEGCQYFLVPKVLAPRLELFRGLAKFFAEPDERIPEAVRVEIGQTGGCKGYTKYLSDKGVTQGLRVRWFRLISKLIVI